MKALIGVFAAATEIQSFCHARGWRSCLIGGLAVQRWGAPRFTQDADLTLLTGFGEEAGFVDQLLKHFPARRADARQFALERRTLLLRSQSGIALDVALGALPFEVRTIERASAWDPGTGDTLVTCSAEDLMVHKVFASRDKDWADVETVLIRQHRSLDLDLVRAELAPLLEIKGAQDCVTRLEQMIARVRRRLSANP